MAHERQHTFGDEFDSLLSNMRWEKQNFIPRRSTAHLTWDEPSLPGTSMREDDEKNDQLKPDIFMPEELPAEDSYGREASSSPQQEVVHNHKLSDSPPSVYQSTLRSGIYSSKKHDGINAPAHQGRKKTVC